MGWTATFTSRENRIPLLSYPLPPSLPPQPLEEDGQICWPKSGGGRRSRQREGFSGESEEFLSAGGWKVGRGFTARTSQESISPSFCANRRPSLTERSVLRCTSWTHAVTPNESRLQTRFPSQMMFFRRNRWRKDVSQTREYFQKKNMPFPRGCLFDCP